MRSVVVTGLIALSLIVSSIALRSFADDREAEQLRETMAALMEQAQQAEDAGQEELAAGLRAKADEILQSIQQQQPAAEPAAAPDAQSAPSPGIEEPLGALHARIADLHRGGRHDQARRLEEIAHHAVRLLHDGNVGAARELLDKALDDRKPEGVNLIEPLEIDRSRVVAEIRIRDVNHETGDEELREEHHGDRRKPRHEERDDDDDDDDDDDEIEERHRERREEREREPHPAERIEHLRIAADHLHAAGLHELAEELQREAEEMQRHHGEQQHERAHDELHHRVRELSEHVRELHERMERIEHMLRRLGERR